MKLILLKIIYAALTGVLLIVSLWNLYQTPYLVLTILLGSLGGAGITWLYYQKLKKLGPIVFAFLLVITYAILCIPACLPTFLQSPIDSLIRIGTGTIFSWKQLVSFSPPIGTFNGLLIPVYFVVFFASFLVMSLESKKFFHSQNNNYILPIISFVVFAFSVSVSLRSTKILAFILGGIYFVLSVIYLSIIERAKITEKSDIKQGKTQFIHSLPFGICVLVIFSVIASFASPLVTGKIYKNLRINPQNIVPPVSSQLDSYRLYFANQTETDPNGKRTQELFKVSDLKGTMPKKLKVASFLNYDLVHMTSNSSFYQTSGKIVGVNGNSSLTINLENYAYNWLPVPDETQSVNFKDNNTYKNSTNLFYSENENSFFDTGDISNAKYQIKFDSGSKLFDLSDVGNAKGNADDFSNFISKKQAPQFYIWMKQEEKNYPGQSVKDLQAILEDLNYYSYLSRSLLKPSADKEGKSWLPDPSYIFSASQTGSNIAHIDTDIFGGLNENAPDCSRKNKQSACGLAVGDEEQFSVAAYLIARYKGFNSRVSLGFDIPDDGVVKGEDLTMWTEVQMSDGSWKGFETSPRIDNHIPPKILDSKPPAYTTQVERENLDYSSANEASPQTNVTVNADSAKMANNNSIELWEIFRIILLILFGILIVLCVFGLIPLAKFARTKYRKKVKLDEEKAVSAWDELVDIFIDLGSTRLNQGTTRVEYAEELSYEFLPNKIDNLINSEQIITSIINIADTADLAVFGEAKLGNSVVDEFVENANTIKPEHESWKKVDFVKKELAKQMGFMAKIKLYFSLRSLKRRK
ncbi:MAG: hypothetical protein LBM13_06290 [Candidatus Ancillula sp.]|nr:hypothetical protein [Candidatus Ancillula sp.]